MKLFALIVALWLLIAGGDGCGAQDAPAEHVHSFGEWTITVAATCTDDGAKIRYCDCGEMQSETIAASHKEYILPAIDATCTESGLTKGMVCSACGEIYIAQQVTPPKAHVEQVIPAIESTCQENGLTEGKRCSSCDTILIAQQTAPLKAHTEVFDNGIAATCTSTGLTDGKHCSSCATVTVIQQTTPIIAHTYDDKYDENCNKCGFIRDAECAHNETKTLEGYAATCTSAGLTDGKQCKKCGEILTSQVAINIVPHFEIIDQVVEATCTSTGLTEGKHCSACSIILIAQTVIPATGHTEVIDKAVEVTCEQIGLSEGKHCSTCNTILVEQEVTPATGHTEVIDEAIAPTCTIAGLTEGKHCSTCRTILVEQTVISARGHSFSDWVIIKEATEAENGLKERYCDCGEMESQNIYFKVSEGLEFTSNGDGTCYVSEIGTCTDTDIVIPTVSPSGDSVTGISASVFRDCSSLTSVIIPDSVTSIGGSAFRDCSSLTSVVIGDSVTSIGGSAFWGCSSLTSVVIGDSVTSIGQEAFRECSSLTSVIIPDSVTSIGDRAFFYCYSLTEIKVDSNNANYKDIDGNLYTKDGKTLVQYAIGKTDTSFTIPDGVTTIGARAFSECSSLTGVVIPDSVTSIDLYSFYNCSNLQFNEYENGKYLGSKDNPYYAFIEVTTQDLSNYTIHEDTKVLAQRAFHNCSNLTSIVIPDSVTSIGNMAFSGCKSLTSVVIGDSVTSIGNSAFQSSSLTSIKYRGSEEQWNAISKSETWDNFTGDYTITYNYDGE